jgi:hypothetical protein
VLYSDEVAHGETEPTVLDVQTNSKDYIVASGHRLLGEQSLIVDVHTGKAVTTFTGQGMLGIASISRILQCC